MLGHADRTSPLNSAFRIPHSALREAMRVLLAGGGTGGHLMPALALAQARGDAGRGIEPVLVGAERGIEAQVLPRYPFRHHLLPMEPIYRRTWWNNVRALVTVGGAWRAVGRVLDAEQPVIVIGTGGYAAGPVVWRAQQRGLPTVPQEQNAFPGLAGWWFALPPLPPPGGRGGPRRRAAPPPRPPKKKPPSRPRPAGGARGG